MARAELAPFIPLRAPVSAEDELSRLRGAVDLPRLIEVGYDPRAQIIRPLAEHRVFGYELCPVVHCTAALERHALCEACWRRFEGFDGTLEEFAALPARASTVRRSSRFAWCAAPRVTSVRRGGAGGCAGRAMPSARGAARRSQGMLVAHSRVRRLGAAVGVGTWRRSGPLSCVSPATGAGWPEASRICLSLRERACVVTAT